MAETRAAARGSVSATYAKGYKTIYCAVLRIRCLDTANALLEFEITVVVVTAEFLNCEPELWPLEATDG